MTKRVWKPLDVNYFRLYEVQMEFSHKHRDWNRHFVVAAHAPTQAAKIIAEIYKDARWLDDECPTFTGYALKIYMPDYWDGAVCDEKAIHPVFGKTKNLKEYAIG